MVRKRAVVATVPGRESKALQWRREGSLHGESTEHGEGHVTYNPEEALISQGGGRGGVPVERASPQA